MTNQFQSGFALLIGVDENAFSQFALPTVAQDVRATYQVLTNPDYCAYPPAQVKVLLGKDATRDNILNGLNWLGEQVQAQGGAATALVYYSGHGGQLNGEFFLLPYDLKSPLTATALRATDFASAIADLVPERLLVLLDCCHAGGMGAKDGDTADTAALPLWASKFVKGAAPMTDFGDWGKGRVVISSSTATQSSYLRMDRTMSVFTYHILAALTGHAQPAAGATSVLVSDLVGYVTRNVSAQVRQEYPGKDQDPVVQWQGENFPVALLAGGKGISAANPAPDPVALVQATLPIPVSSQINATQSVVIIGNNSGTIQNQPVAITGNITAETLALGAAAQAHHTDKTTDNTSLQTLFIPLLLHLAKTQPAAVTIATQLQAEVAKTSGADDERIADLIEQLMAAAPNVASDVVALFSSNTLGQTTGAATRYVLKKIRRS
jgi:hypothetical protein